LLPDFQVFDISLHYSDESIISDVVTINNIRRFSFFS